jgi:hypothetical protein
MSDYSFWDDSFKKKVFRFSEKPQPEFHSQRLEIGSKQKICVTDSSGMERELVFTVQRDVLLGSGQRWIYGSIVKDTGENGHLRLEIKLYRNHPELNSIELFRQAPPLL